MSTTWTDETDRRVKKFISLTVESPIEELFIEALRGMLGANGYKLILCLGLDDLYNTLSERPNYIAVSPQVDIGHYRVDFLIAALAGTYKYLVVECDGHEFHETKKQAALDRRRDRELQLLGYDVFRFTGSEIYNCAPECAMDVVEWLRLSGDS